MVSVRSDIHPSAPPDAPPSSTIGEGNAVLRVEALRQLHWQRREWECRLAMHPPGAPCLIALAHRARLNDGLDLLREAGEHIPSRFYQRGSNVRSTNVAGGATGTARLANLVADISQVLHGLTLSRAPLTGPSRLDLHRQTQLAPGDHGVGDQRHRTRTAGPRVAESRQEQARRDVRAVVEDLTESDKEEAA